MSSFSSSSSSSAAVARGGGSTSGHSREKSSSGKSHGSGGGGGGGYFTSKESSRTAETLAPSFAAEAGEGSEGSVARPYSALMAELFSPVQTPSQSACAEAAALATARFSVPETFDPCFYNQPDPQSVLVHSVTSTHAFSGLQAVIVLHPKSSLPSHLGLSQTFSGASASEETCFLMTAPKNQPFVAYHHAPKAAVIQVSLTEYLTLLSFWTREWPRVSSKLLFQADLMRTGQDLIPISSTLAFYHHGCSVYSVHLSSRLMLKAKSDSKLDPAAKTLRAWLELKVSSNQGSGGSENQAECPVQVFCLPVEALSELTQDVGASNTLNNLVANYKSRSRKRSKPVA